MSSGLRDLRIWQDSVALGGDVVRALRPQVRRETHAVSDAIMLTALSVGAHVADGYARHTPAGQRESYMLARRALLRLESELAVARHAELVPAAACAEFSTRSGQLSRMLTGFLLYLDRQIADQPAGSAAPESPLPIRVSPDFARGPS